MGRSWGEIPLPLRIFAVIALVEMPWLVVVTWDHRGMAAFTFAFMVLIAVLVLRGSRVVWVFLVAIEAGTLAASPWIGPGPWWGVLLGLGETALLVWPSSFRFVWRRRPKPAPLGATEQTTWDAGAEPDSERLDGWYVDPGNPHRMRYWHGETAEWVGSAKTPRKLRSNWPEAVVTAPAAQQTTWDPEAQPDADRPRGWYVEPGNPDRMRYWSGEESGWRGRSKTPRKIREEWEGRS